LTSPVIYIFSILVCPVLENLDRAAKFPPVKPKMNIDSCRPSPPPPTAATAARLLPWLLWLLVCSSSGGCCSCCSCCIAPPPSASAPRILPLSAAVALLCQLLVHGEEEGLGHYMELPRFSITHLFPAFYCITHLLFYVLVLDY
jgi:hypothetical protein